MTFSVNGRGHRVLRALADGPLPPEELIELVAPCGSYGRRKRAHFLLVSMIQAGLVRPSGFLRGHHITSDGREALIDLDGGFCVETAAPTPRVTYCRRVA
jgi:hypothetical protein